MIVIMTWNKRSEQGSGNVFTEVSRLMEKVDLSGDIDKEC